MKKERSIEIAPEVDVLAACAMTLVSFGSIRLGSFFIS
jgi:hypothetical protein